LDRVRLVVQAVLALAVLGGATYLTHTGQIDGQALVALYGAALGAVGSGAVGGTRSTAAPAPHVHESVMGNGSERTGREEKP